MIANTRKKEKISKQFKQSETNTNSNKRKTRSFQWKKLGQLDKKGFTAKWEEESCLCNPRTFRLNQDVIGRHFPVPDLQTKKEGERERARNLHGASICYCHTEQDYNTDACSQLEGELSRQNLTVRILTSNSICCNKRPVTWLKNITEIKYRPRLKIRSAILPLGIHGEKLKE